MNKVIDNILESMDKNYFWAGLVAQLANFHLFNFYLLTQLQFHLYLP